MNLSTPLHTFSYTPDRTNDHDQIMVTIQTQSSQLEHVLQAMEAYLKAAGFVVDGRQLDLVNVESASTLSPVKVGVPRDDEVPF